jgi:hypothetical protein
MTAMIELTVSRPKTGQTLARETFEMEEALARQFMQQIERMLATLDRPVQVTKTLRPDDRTILEIVADPTGRKPAPVISDPTFEQLFRRRQPLALLPAPPEAPDE